MTLKGHTALYCTNGASFGGHHRNLKEDRAILSVTETQHRDSTFRWHKAHVDIHRSSRVRGLKQQWGG